MNDYAMLCYAMLCYAMLSIVDLESDDSVAASSPFPEVADNPGPLEVDSSLSQLDDDPEEEEPACADHRLLIEGGRRDWRR